jgi:hypothetical protein
MGTEEQGAASHDEEAFSEALIAAVRPAYRALRAMGLSEDDAADILQDASIRAGAWVVHDLDSAVPGDDQTVLWHLVVPALG